MTRKLNNIFMINKHHNDQCNIEKILLSANLLKSFYMADRLTTIEHNFIIISFFSETFSDTFRNVVA